ncbi:spondin domain-containing protein [Psychromonas aquimarina]|uniref:spondin domain-containing protein n=1 Tax=Psychromonas aquimarina TaxID=444919 RepID=UPI00041FFF9A|nr:spondin domain-containing protein [Psychromonas aquimarina]
MNNKQLAAAGLISLFSIGAGAKDLNITITNLSYGIYFTPIIAAAHDNSTNIFTPAADASAELQALAEGGDISGVSGSLAAAGADIVENPAAGLLAGSAGSSFTLSASAGNRYLSLAAMMLPTNDGFVGLDSWKIPSKNGTYTIWLNAYDAGTEANDELIVGGAGGAPGVPGIPAAPGGDAGVNGTGVSDPQSNGKVHIHRGVVGDDLLNAGQSDLDKRVHRWLNPVAKVTVTVSGKKH